MALMMHEGFGQGGRAGMYTVWVKGISSRVLGEIGNMIDGIFFTKLLSLL